MFCCIFILLFVYSSVHGHLSYFRFLSILNNAAINIGVQIIYSVLAFSSFENISKSGIVGLYSNSMLVFFLLRNHHTPFIVASPFYISISSAKGFQFLHILSFFFLSPPPFFFFFNYLYGYEVVSYCSFGLHFLSN